MTGWQQFSATGRAWSGASVWRRGAADGFCRDNAKKSAQHPEGLCAVAAPAA
ncbi:hypothetical protein LHGZ1_3169 [Laribacter hongkongensis]|uniref:Uncharacterized protein n=1 Tax=Laribacter hongkongensis TaxID=168471 RepID=A0A248LMI3_9NEIS|nr:hypothetical protein LHGZ1_3169 [Laribacter hongkongensis]